MKKFVMNKSLLWCQEISLIQHDVENEKLRKENEKLKEENGNEKVETRNEKLETRNEKVERTNENKQFKKNIMKEEPKEIKSLNWIDKNKFKEILAIIDSNTFDYGHKIGDFRYTETGDFVNKIGNNTIREIDAKKDLNELKKKTNERITKQKKRTCKQKESLNLFNNLSDIILTNKTLE